MDANTRHSHNRLTVKNHRMPMELGHDDSNRSLDHKIRTKSKTTSVKEHRNNTYNNRFKQSYKSYKGSGNLQVKNSTHNSMKEAKILDNHKQVNTSKRACTNVFSSTTARYLVTPVKLNYEKCRNSPLINLPQKKSTQNYYNLEEPILSIHNNRQSIISNLISEIRFRYHTSQIVKLGLDRDYAIFSLNQIHSVVEDYIKNSQKSQKRSLASSTQTVPLVQRIDQLSLVDPSVISTTESVDLSFDGKALDKSDIFRIVDSFSLACDDEDDEQSFVFNTTNILPKEISNQVF